MENFRLKVRPMALHPTIDNPQKYDLSHFCVLPMSVLEKLDKSDLLENSPYCFKLDTEAMVRDVYVSVLEFSAEDGIIFLPKILMDNCFIRDYEGVTLQYICAPKGSEIIFQPEDDSFYDIVDNKELLETHISHNYKILQLGDRIGFMYDNKEIFLEITHLEPCDVVLAHETEMVLDYTTTIAEEQANNHTKREEREMATENKFLADLHKEREKRRLEKNI